MRGFMAGFLAGAAAATAVGAWLLYLRRRTLARFFSFAVHELNTPVTAINMTLLNFLAGVFGEIGLEQMQWFEILREQTGRLSAMVGELGDFARLEFGGKLPGPGAEVAAGDVVESGLRCVARSLAQAGIGVRLEVAENLPRLRADSERLSRTLAALLFHARKFRVSGDILIAAGRPEPAGPVELRVEFTGPKIPPSERERSLKLYYPARRRKDHILIATGLGLGFSRALMRRQGGDLKLSLDPDGRTRLSLLAPCSP